MCAMVSWKNALAFPLVKPLGVWPCPNCKTMASDIKEMRKSLDKLTSYVKDLLKIQQTAQSRQELLDSELNSLRETVKTLTNENNELKTKSLTADQPVSNNRCLIIGSSIIRNFDEAKLPNHQVCCMPGAYMTDILNKLNSLAQLSPALVSSPSALWLVATMPLAPLVMWIWRALSQP